MKKHINVLERMAANTLKWNIYTLGKYSLQIHIFVKTINQLYLAHTYIHIVAAWPESKRWKEMVNEKLNPKDQI